MFALDKIVRTTVQQGVNILAPENAAQIEETENLDLPLSNTNGEPIFASPVGK